VLYDSWRQVVGERASEVALWELSSGRRWTFRELDQWAESAGRPNGGVVFPRGMGAEFVRSVLTAWRWGCVVCPLEEGQSAPALEERHDDWVHFKTTSATTGAARVIVFRAEQLLADVENIRSTMGLRREFANVGAISLAHSYGFSSLVLPLLILGIPLVLCGSGLPELLRKSFRLVGPVTLPGVPVLWRHWYDSGVLGEGVKLAISAGATLPLKVEQAIYARFGLKVHNFYGASECGGIAYDRSEVPRTQVDLVGGAMDGVELTVEDGRLTVRSDAVGAGYLGESSVTLGCGVYQTTDLAELVDGRVLLRGRAVDVINMAGRKVYPQAIEDPLSRHPAVRGCLVVGVPGVDSVKGDRIVAVVVAGEPLTAEVLSDYLRLSLPDWQVPREWCFVDSLQTDVRGKISRVAWRERLRSGSTGGGDQA
jgi:long-chain acyl-CoA synthetase